MSAAANPFIWYDLMTTDSTAALAFYQAVVGWSGQTAAPPNDSYTILGAGETKIGGVMALDPRLAQSGVPPHWIGYIVVEEVDEMAGRISAASGSILHPPQDIPDVGRFAVAADPHGAAFIIFRPKPGVGGGAVPPPAGATPGRIGWHELHTDEVEGAFGFYAALFGWTKAEAVDMGPMGIYQTFATGDVAAGGMVIRNPAAPAPYWSYYINVEAIPAAAARVRDAGGRVVTGPQQVPGGSWILHGLDPQGAHFALVGPG